MAHNSADSWPMPVISAFRDLGLLGGDFGLVFSDLGLMLRYINKSVYALEIIRVVICTYFSVSTIFV